MPFRRSAARLLRPRPLLLALVATLAVLVVLPRLVVESQWFAQFQAAPVLWRRWLFQLLAFSVVMGLGVPLQLQQLQRCWRLRREAPRKRLPEAPLLALGSAPLVAVLPALLLQIGRAHV